jgi:prepilin-type processing-associated H-X9-DG protein
VSMKVQRRYLTVPELFAVIAVFLIMAILFLSLCMCDVSPFTIRRSREKGRRVNCAGNLKQIGLSSLMYSGDYGGYFPNLNSRGLGSGVALFGNWQPLGSMQYIADHDNKVWTCPSVTIEKSDADCSNYRYIGSGLKDDNDSASLVPLGYDASGNHPENAWMNALFLDGHVQGARPDGSKIVFIIERIPGQPDRSTVSSWNRNDW